MTTKDKAPLRTEPRRTFRFSLRAAAIIGLVAGGSAAPGYAASTPSIRTAVVSASGKLVRGKGAVSSRLVPVGPAGIYEVTFATSVAKCAFFTGSGDSTIPTSLAASFSSATISPFNIKTVVVGTFFEQNNHADLPFNLLVVC